jgi:2-methylisocitrate lyase-like PEP mutase family enzyme
MRSLTPDPPSSASPPARLRGLLAGDAFLTMPCCFDALSARLIEQAGFPLTFMSGFAVAAARLGLPDTGLITVTEMLDQGRAICQAVTLANMLEGGITPILPPVRLEDLGYRIAAYPLTLLAAAVAAMRDALGDLAAGRTPPRLTDFATLRAMLGFDDYDRLLAAYADPDGAV